jgi:hypothetical protein
MKKFILITVLCLAGMELLSQPVFEHSYNESASICTLDGLGEVYYAMDVMNRQCLIYDMGHNLIKSIPIPTPEGYYLEDIQHLSSHLFNGDNLLELVYIYSMYVPTEQSYYFIYEAKLINENGNVLFTLPGVGFTDVIETVAGGKKFMAYEYNFSVIPYRTYTHVYSLPGQDTRSVSQSLTGFDTGNPYPNPSGGEVRIPVVLPPGVESAKLELWDLYGRRILGHPVSGSTGDLLLPSHSLEPGSYIYQVNAPGWKSSAKQIIIR